MATISIKRLAEIRMLYYDRKLSMSDIAKHYNVSLDKVVYFMRRNNLTRRSHSLNNSIRFERKPLSFKLKNKLTKYQLELKNFGIALYWGEGYKAEGGSGIDFANSDVKMIVVFLNFLRVICGVDEKRLRVLLYCYSNQDIEKLLGFWSKRTKIPLSQFSKPYVRYDFRKEKINKMPFGLIHIRYQDKKLRALILEWIEEYKNKFAQIVP
ncbi:MAG: hypothetical protein Q8P86_01945 [bacterium]|nr:hypothetical protein [bacterium]